MHFLWIFSIVVVRFRSRYSRILLWSDRFLSTSDEPAYYKTIPASDEMIIDTPTIERSISRDEMEVDSGLADDTGMNTSELSASLEKYKQRTLLLQTMLLSAQSSVDSSSDNNQELVRLQRQVSNLTSQLSSCQSEMVTLRAALAEAGQRLRQSLQRETNFSSTIVSLKKQSSDDRAEFRVREQQARMATERQLVALRKQILRLEGSLSGAEELAESRGELADMLEAEVVALQTRVEEGKEKLSQMGERSHNLSADFASLKSSLIAESSRVTLLTTLSQSLQQQLTQSKEDLEAAAMRENELRTQLERYERRLLLLQAGVARSEEADVSLEIESVTQTATAATPSEAVLTSDRLSELTRVSQLLADSREMLLKTQLLLIETSQSSHSSPLTVWSEKMLNLVRQLTRYGLLSKQKLRGIIEVLFKCDPVTDDAIFLYSQTLLESR